MTRPLRVAFCGFALLSVTACSLASSSVPRASAAAANTSVVPLRHRTPKPTTRPSATPLPSPSPVASSTASVLCPHVLARQGLVHPAAGASAVSTSIGSIVVSGPIATLTLITGSGASVILSDIVSGSPQTSTTFAAPVFAGKTAYAVYASDLGATPGCPQSHVFLGSFTTDL